MITFSLPAKSLKDTLNTFQKFLPEKAETPFDTLYFSRGGSGPLVLTKSNFEVTLEASIEIVGVPIDLYFSCSAAYLAKLIKLAEGKTIEFKSITDGTWELSCEGMSFFLPVVKHGSSEVFPEIQKESINPFSTRVSDLVSGLKGVVSAVADNDARYIHNGVNFKVDHDVLRVSATDGRRCHVFRCPAQIWKITQSITIPGKVLKVFVKLFSKHNREIGIDSNPQTSHVIISDLPGNMSLKVKVLDGEFPDVERIIPAKFRNHCVISKKDLLNIVKQNLNRDNSRPLKFECDMAGVLFVSRESPKGGSEIFRVILKTSECSVSEVIKLNPYYLRDAIDAFDDTTTLTMHWNTQEVLAITAGAGEFSRTASPICLLAPMR